EVGFGNGARSRLHVGHGPGAPRPQWAARCRVVDAAPVARDRVGQVGRDEREYVHLPAELIRPDAHCLPKPRRHVRSYWSSRNNTDRRRALASKGLPSATLSSPSYTWWCPRAVIDQLPRTGSGSRCAHSTSATSSSWNSSFDCGRMSPASSLISTDPELFQLSLLGPVERSAR